MEHLVKFNSAESPRGVGYAVCATCVPDTPACVSIAEALNGIATEFEYNCISFCRPEDGTTIWLLSREFHPMQSELHCKSLSAFIGAVEGFPLACKARFVEIERVNG
jgi:hypothetical protein